MKKRGAIKITLIAALLLCLTVALGSLFVPKGTGGALVLGEEVLTFKTFRGEFVASVKEAGDIESSSNFEIRCRVKALGKAGTPILDLIEEGTEVTQGQFLCQLDDSLLTEQLTQQKIQVAQDRAAKIQAESDLNTARQILDEFENGTYEQELAGLDAEVALAEETLRRTREIKNHSENLNRKGYITKTQLEADTFAMDKAELDLKLAKQKLQVYKKFTKSRMSSEYTAEIQKQEAFLEAAVYTLELSESRVTDTEQQIANCRVTAPHDGTLIYANETDRGESAFVIEEGALLRDGQPIFFLPDPAKMQVRVKVSDSKINDVEEGQEALIRIDTAPENPVRGMVRRVSKFPMPTRWYQAPKEYEVFVDIVELNDLIRPGLRGKVEMFSMRIADVIQAPVSSLLRKNDEYFVLVKKLDGLDVRKVDVGKNNDQFVIVQAGLEPDEEVLVDPDSFQDLVKFPKG